MNGSLHHVWQLSDHYALKMVIVYIADMAHSGCTASKSRDLPMCDCFLCHGKWTTFYFSVTRHAATTIQRTSLSTGPLGGRLARNKGGFLPTIINLRCRYQYTNSVNHCPSLGTERATTPVQDWHLICCSTPRGYFHVTGLSKCIVTNPNKYKMLSRLMHSGKSPLYSLCDSQLPPPLPRSATHSRHQSKQWQNSWNTPGGGMGLLGIYIGGGVPWHTKKGGSWVRAQPKKGGLRCRHSPQKRGLRCGHNQKKGGLRHV